MSVFIRRLQNHGVLDPSDIHVLTSIFSRQRLIAPDQDIAREGDTPSECTIILSGLASRYKVLANGRRQILSFHIPGDLVDLQAFLLGLDHNIGSLTQVQVGTIPYSVLNVVMTEHPRIARALWRTALTDSAIFREHIATLGRRTAAQRLAHLLCELYSRYQAVDLAQGGSVEFHATQAELGDALGLSYVHVNRILQSLRSEGLISLRGTSLVILNWAGLKGRADFDENYLHVGDVRGEPREF